MFRFCPVLPAKPDAEFGFFPPKNFLLTPTEPAKKSLAESVQPFLNGTKNIVLLQ